MRICGLTASWLSLSAVLKTDKKGPLASTEERGPLLPLSIEQNRKIFSKVAVRPAEGLSLFAGRGNYMRGALIVRARTRSSRKNYLGSMLITTVPLRNSELLEGVRRPVDGIRFRDEPDGILASPDQPHKGHALRFKPAIVKISSIQPLNVTSCQTEILLRSLQNL